MAVKKILVWSVLGLFFWGGMVQPALSEKGDDEMVVRYQNGLKMMTKDKKFKFMIGGRIYADFAIFDPDDTFKNSFEDGDQVAGGEIRSARIYFSGLLYEKVKFKLQLDFASTSDGEQPNFKDVYIQLIKIPVIGNLRVGHQKEPWSLENMTSTKYNSFMERSVINALDRDRSLGVSIFDHALGRRLTWSTGFFFDTLNEAPPVANFDNNPQSVGISLRLTGLPLYQDKGKKLIHFGFSYALEDEGKDDLVRLHTKPEAHLTSFSPVETKDQPGTQVHRYVIELAGVYGPFSLQGEYVAAVVKKPAGTPDADYSGYYVQASYYLTGEHRAYNTRYGIFGRTQLHRNFDNHGGWGAWEVALRLSNIDLNTGDPTGAANGGEMTDITFGLNWYLNPQSRIMFNYIHSDVESGGTPIVDAGTLDIYQFRFQVVF